ncbi:hypothetical protein H70357_11540 [Paenibacillus sp. FSL H7-0357]|nr:hypothetical protein H70357_11540 [Paenibacillus sp. FSL H7-0357]
MGVKQGRSIWTLVLDLLITAISAVIFYYIFVVAKVRGAQVVAAAILLLSAVIIAVRTRPKKIKAQNKVKPGSKVVKLVLLSDDGESVKEWYIEGETSVLIGKSSRHGEADIDLSDTPYASLISAQHAVLNKASGKWYIEDIESSSGVGIRKSNQSKAVKLEIEEPSLLEAGDLIYIANTRILVK